MKIIHRITAGDESAIADLRRAGVDVSPPKDDYDIFVAEIADDDPRWPRIAMIQGMGPTLTHTEFSKQELADADFVALVPEWMNGYPEPSDHFGYRPLIYDLSDYCPECGSGKRQKAPFRLKKPPTWGRRSIFVLNWIYDEFFVPPEIWESRFKPFGIGSREVVLDRTGAVLDNVAQLDVPTIVELDMQDRRLQDLKPEPCGSCGRLRYGRITRGYQPRPTAPPPDAMFKSAQDFGTGHRSEKLVYVSQDLYQRVADLRGVVFEPCLPPFPLIPLL